nr:unnamed protein product [Spirometra erinaceieuropaei]
MQDAWTAQKAEEIRGYTDRNKWKYFSIAIKAVYGTVAKGTAPLLSADVTTLLTEKTQILQRWAEHFGGVLNRPSTIFDAAIARLPQLETNTDLELPPPFSSKSSGPDISLLNIAGKIFARILLNRLNSHLELGLLPKIQCGFSRHRRITDISFAVPQLQKKCQEMPIHPCYPSVDLMRAFDSVNREGLWQMMHKFGRSERFTQTMRQLHDGMTARVTDNGAVSEAFAVTNGVKHGPVLTPTLFSFMFSAILMDAYRDERPGIRFAYRTNDHPLNQWRMRFQSHVAPTTVHETLFVGHCAVNVATEGGMQRNIDHFAAAYENFG